MYFVSAFETSFILLILVFVGYAFFPDDPAYLGIHPHPYFVVLILSSLRYPRLASLLSTVLVAGTLAAQVWFSGLAWPIAGPILFKYGILFLICNLVLAELGSMFYREIVEARERFAEKERAHEMLKAQYDALQLVKDELSERIVGQTSSILSLYEAAKRLESLDSGQIHSALLEITAKFIGAESCSLFLVDPKTQKARLERRYGWTADEKAERGRVRFEIGDAILGRVVEERRMVTLKEIGSERTLADAAKETSLPTILAAPLVHEGKVQAVLNVEKLPFLKYSPTNIRLFYLIADLGSTALANSRRFAQMKKENIVDQDTGMATVNYLETCMRAELQRWRRTDLMFSFCLLQIDDLESLKSQLGKRMESLHSEFARLALQAKREIDVAARLPTGEIAFLLPITPIQGATVFCRKIQQNVLGKIEVNVGGRNIKLSASLGVTCPQGRGDFTVETLYKRARGALRSALQDGGSSVQVDAGIGGDL